MTLNNTMRNARIAVLSVLTGAILTAILFAIALIGKCLLYYISLTTLCIVTAAALSLLVYCMAVSVADAYEDPAPSPMIGHHDDED